MRRTRQIVAIALGLAAAACSSREADDSKKPAQPVIYDVRGEATKMGPDGVEEHVHTWEQAGIHPYQVIRNGVPNTELCVISRCTKCGEQLHECERRTGRRKQDPAR